MLENTIRELTDAELDAVTGGQPQQGLVNVNVEDTNVFLAVPVAANVNANVLGVQEGIEQQARAGRIRQQD
jgi:hypothetical protein